MVKHLCFYWLHHRLTIGYNEYVYAILSIDIVTHLDYFFFTFSTVSHIFDHNFEIFENF